MTIRNTLRQADYPRQLNSFVSQLERLTMVVVLLLFGLAIGNGLLHGLNLAEFALALLALFVVRPLATSMALWRSKLARNTRRALAYFGIRGVGALYYLSYSVQRSSDLPQAMTASVAFVVMLSIVVYGATTAPFVRWLQLDEEHRPAGPYA